MGQKIFARQRQYERYVPAHDVTVEVEAESVRPARGDVRNLSLGGACLSVQADLVEGDELILRLGFAAPIRTVPATGRVVWVERRTWGRPRYGVEWTHNGPQRAWLGWLVKA
jgi:hypothetical protein